MNRTHRTHPAHLIALGLFGLAALPLALHLPHPAAMERDGWQGLWLGLCLGLQCLGLVQLRKKS